MHQLISSADMQRQPDGLSGGTYYCVSPDIVQTPDAISLLSQSDAAALKRDRLLVVDGRIPQKTLDGALEEFRAMLGKGTLSSDPDDMCAPMQRSFTIPLDSSVKRTQVQGYWPHLNDIIRATFNLPALFSEALGKDLRVPQSVMLAAYPPGAAYSRHKDSYDGFDIPRYLTVLIYLGWQPQVGGALRCHGLKHVKGGSRDVEPTPGRICVFFAQEIEHEVLVSHGERFALTLWVWDTKQDEHGR